MKPILLTGFRPTGDFHLGHYLSLIEPLIKHKNDYRIFLMVADLHAQTGLRQPKVNYQSFSDDLECNILFALQIITDFLDPKDFVVFRQSDLREYHLDLFYKLLMVSRHNLTFGNPVFIDAMRTEIHNGIDLLKLEPVIKSGLKQFIQNHPEVLWGNISDQMEQELYMFLAVNHKWIKKEAVTKIVKHLNTRIGVMGFATYPILMAADIILYQPEYTLVGRDQSPHIQIANDLVKILNKTFDFKVKPTKPMIDLAQTLKGNDGCKMSKSLGNYIPLKHLLRKDNLGFDWFLKMKSYPRRINEAGKADECLVAQYWNQFDCYLNNPMNISEICAKGVLSCFLCKDQLFKTIKIIIQKNMRENRIFEDTDQMLKDGAEVARQRILEGELIKKHFI